MKITTRNTSVEHHPEESLWQCQSNEESLESQKESLVMWQELTEAQQEKLSGGKNHLNGVSTFDLVL